MRQHDLFHNHNRLQSERVSERHVSVPSPREGRRRGRGRRGGGMKEGGAARRHRASANRLLRQLPERQVDRNHLREISCPGSIGSVPSFRPVQAVQAHHWVTSNCPRTPVPLCAAASGMHNRGQVEQSDSRRKRNPPPPLTPQQIISLCVGGVFD